MIRPNENCADLDTTEVEDSNINLILIFLIACRQLFKKAQLLGYSTGQVMAAYIISACLFNSSSSVAKMFILCLTLNAVSICSVTG